MNPWGPLHDSLQFWCAVVTPRSLHRLWCSLPKALLAIAKRWITSSTRVPLLLIVLSAHLQICAERLPETSFAYPHHQFSKNKNKNNKRTTKNIYLPRPSGPLQRGWRGEGAIRTMTIILNKNRSIRIHSDHHVWKSVRRWMFIFNFCMKLLASEVTCWLDVGAMQNTLVRRVSYFW